ncbi:MAG: flagellin [Oscillospiraceae bacterium]|nr:flagellin [Oscillospiraceae bacterium]
MIIQHNIPAMNSHRQLGINNGATSKNLEKLSSGFRINRAGDDAAGLAISEKMRGQIRGLAQATQNAQNGISLIQTAEGGLNETHAILQRMRELAVQSANGTYKDEVDRENIAKEVTALKSEIDRIASSTHYNGIHLLNGTMGGVSAKLNVDPTLAFHTFNVNGTDMEISHTIRYLLNGSATSTTGFGVGAAGSSAGVDDLRETLLAGGVEVTITVKVLDGATVASIQIGDKSYTTIPGDAAGANRLYDANGDYIGQLHGFNPASAIEGVLSGIRIVNQFIPPGGGNAVWNGLLAADGALLAQNSSKLVFQIGANGSADQRVGLRVPNMSSGALGNATGSVNTIRVDTREKANDAIKVINDAMNQVSGVRADLGALQNRLEHTVNNLGVTRENLQNAEASIRDVDMAKEMMEFTKNNILVQASQTMLAQSNQLPQGVLQLLR